MQDSREYLSAGEQMDDDLEALLNKGRYYATPFTCSVAISADGLRYAAVGIKLFGKSKNRKGRWTRCAIAASCPIEEGLAGLVPKMRKLYAEYAANRHKNLNYFVGRLRRTRSMKAK